MAAVNDFVPPDADLADPSHAVVVEELRRLVPGLSTKRSFRQQLITTGFRFVTWAQAQGVPVEDMFTEPVIARFVDESGGLTRQRTFVFDRLNRLASAVDEGGLARLAARCGASPSEPMAAQRHTPSDVDALIESFRPDEVSEARWEVISATVRSWVGQLGTDRVERARLALRMVGLLAAWHVERGGMLAPVDVFDRDNVDEFLRVAGYPQKSMRSYRSVIRAVGRAVTGSQVVRSKPAAGQVLPYTDSDIRDLLQSATTSPQRRTRRAMRSMLLVGAATGVGGSGLVLLRPEHVDIDGNAVLVRVPNPDGSTNRVVPALGAWAALLAAHVTECVEAGDEFLIGGVGQKRVNRPASLAKRLGRLHGGGFDPVRLRRYWLVEVFSGAVHLPSALTAAGWTTPQQLFELLPLLRPAPEPVAWSMLQEPGRRLR